MTVTSKKGTKIIVKSEVAGLSSKPFKERAPKKFEEARREYELIGTDMETEYEEIDTAEVIGTMYPNIPLSSANLY